MQSKISLCLLCQGKHIWETCQSCCRATAETSAKVPTTTVVVALVCMLLLLTKSVSFSCHKPELIWLSFRESMYFHATVKKLGWVAFQGHYWGVGWGVCFISWRSTDKTLSWAEHWLVIHEFQVNVRCFNDEEHCCYWKESWSGVETNLFLNKV